MKSFKSKEVRLGRDQYLLKALPTLSAHRNQSGGGQASTGRSVYPHITHRTHTHTHTHLWIRYTHADRQKHAEAEAHTQTHTHTHTQRRPEFGRWVIAAEKLIHAQLSSLTFNKNKKQTNKRRQIRVLFNLSVAGFCFRSKKRTLEPPLTRKGQLLGERTAVRLHVELLLKEIF